MISDRGPGFVPSQAATNGHLGLASMRERAELLGGRFRVQSSSNGTSVHLRWPLTAEASHRTSISEVIGSTDRLVEHEDEVLARAG